MAITRSEGDSWNYFQATRTAHAPRFILAAYKGLILALALSTAAFGVPVNAVAGDRTPSALGADILKGLEMLQQTVGGALQAALLLNMQSQPMRFETWVRLNDQNGHIELLTYNTRHDIATEATGKEICNAVIRRARSVCGIDPITGIESSDRMTCGAFFFPEDQDNQAKIETMNRLIDLKVHLLDDNLGATVCAAPLVGNSVSFE